ncbi:5-formyltetrahydrofolate cyclo-ligase [Phenylobacterium sp.]|uniref:5-formyltetrahydrofolate cyclo-ligase n=1 Tax=Phenylobacterium sp. TaxID=1871053 RepID=UPI00289CAD57|nr:5-formyltetrahydrofolate cyclo-ligase [Phenylobacterium sp.]
MNDPSDKAKLRARLRKRRRALDAARPDAARAAAEALPLERLPAFEWFASYHALGSELDPAPLAARLTRAGKRLALPVTLAADAPLAFRAWRAGDVPEIDAFGVPSPPPSAPEVWPGLVICPLLAFDRAGGRLGQGGGHYDRTIEALRARGPVFVLGLAYAGQEVEALDMEPHDQRLDAILTENGYTEVRKD